MQSIKPIYEFLLWPNCRNNCKFCFLKKEQDNTDQEKISALSSALSFIESDRFKKGSHVLILGGEVFDSPSIHQELNKFFSIIVSKMCSNHIDLLYINTNLIYKKLDALEFLIQQLDSNSLLNKLKFTSSYDLDGRFNKHTEQLMLNNLQYLMNKYARLNTAINIILTQKVCNYIVEDKLNIKEFMDTYKVYVNLIPYIVYDASIAADRNLVFKALSHAEKQCPGYLYSYIKNFDLPQKKLLHKYNKATKQFEYCSCDDLSCGHSENFKKYSTSGTCFICDIKELFLNE